MILFYELPRFERAAVIRFVQEGLKRRAKNVMLLPDTRISSYNRLLQEHGLDARALRANGSVDSTRPTSSSASSAGAAESTGSRPS